MRLKPIGLPLLGRELTEASARRSTYIFRVLVALILSIVGLIVLGDVVTSRNPYRILGHGRDLMEAVVHTEFVYIYGLLPILACGAFTEEKERDTLPLLLLTRLGPWTIVFEKILGRLVPTLAIILLSLPLLTFAYSLGGFSLIDLIGAAWLLITGSLQVITISVVASAYCRKTVSAFLLAWTIGITTACVPLVLDEMRVINIRLEEMMFAPALFTSMIWRPLDLGWVMFVSIPTLLICGAATAVSRYLLTRCETQTGKNPLVRILGQLDGAVRDVLKHCSKGRLRLDTTRPLPHDRPVYWKETSCDTFNKPRYRTYAVVLGLIVLPIAAAIGADAGGDEGLACVYFGFLSLVAMGIVTRSATLISSERSHQTLDILMSTPMTSREFVAQKMAGIHQLMWTFSIPFLAMLVVDGLFKYFNQDSWFQHRRHEDDFSLWLYLLTSIVTVAIYLPMLSWLATLIGLRSRKQMTALFLSLTFIVAWALIPLFVVIGIFETVGVRPGDPSTFLLLASPLPFILLNELFEVHQMLPRTMPVELLFVFNSVIYGTALFVLRRLCYSRLDKVLGRADSP